MVVQALMQLFVTVIVLGLDPVAAALVGYVAALHGMFQHWNVRTPRWLGYLIQRPEAHCEHHRLGVHANNYADLPLWDLLFASFRNPASFDGRCGFAAPADRRMLAMLAWRDVSADDYGTAAAASLPASRERAGRRGPRAARERPCNNRPMDTRALGRSGLQVSPICLGGNVFGWTADEAISLRLLDAWVDAGMNFVDTADVYSRWVRGHMGGESETVIGKWLRQSGKRRRVVLATKVGKPMGENDKGLSRAYIRRAVEASLRRLQTDFIDLYQAHDDDAATPLEETLATFAELIKEGKVRAVGASNYTAPRLALALDTSERLGLPRYESLQPLYNLVERAAYEDELEPLCVERGLGVINFFALAMGFLTGKYRSVADLGKSVRGGGAIKQYLNERGLRGPRRARRRRRGRRRDTRASRDRLADRAAEHHRADRERDHARQLAELVGAARLRLDAPSIAALDRASRASEA